VGTNGGVGASWLRRRGGVVAGVFGLAVVVAIVAFQLRTDGPAVIRLAAGAGGDDTLAVAEMDSLPARADLLLLHPVEYRFILGDGARFDDGEARAWTLQPPTDLEAAADDLADHFGLGPAVPAPYGDGFVAGDTDRGGPTLWVGPGGEWSYHAPDEGLLWDCVQPALPLPDPADDDAADRDAGPDTPTTDRADEGEGATVKGPVEGTAEGGQPQVLVTPDDDCEPPTPPAGVPTEAEARVLAETLFADLGLPGDVTIQEVWADDWGAWVHGATTLGGVPTDLSVSAAWGGEGKLTSIASTLAEPTDEGNYPTVDAERAVQRLEEQGGGWGGLPIARPLPAIGSLDAPTRSDNLASSAASSSDEDDAPAADPVPDADPEPMPTEPVIDLPRPDPDAEPEVVEVTLVDVAPVLLVHWDVDGTAWLLPGYRFTDAEGGVWQVLAVSDDYLDVGEPEVPAPGVPEPGVIDPAEPEPGVGPDPDDGGSGGGVEPEPGDVPGGPGDEVPPTDGVADPAEGEEPGEPEPGASPEARDLAHRTIGMAEEDAIELAEAAGLAVRVVERDGEGLPRTDDLQPDRVNLHVEDGIVVHATLG
jgi:hypothetical protein